VFGWLTQAAATVGVPISPQGLEERFGPESADCLREVLEAAVRTVVATDPVAVPVLQRFGQVVVQDCTASSLPDALAEVWPGCGGSTPTAGAVALKLGVRLDLATGELSGLHVEAERTNDRATIMAGLPLAPGTLRLADLGFFSLAEVAEQDAAGVFWVSRLQAGTALFAPDGQRQEVLTLLARPPGDRVGCAGPGGSSPATAVPAASGAGTPGGGRSAAAAVARDGTPQGTRRQPGPLGALRLGGAAHQCATRPVDAAGGPGGSTRPMADRTAVHAMEAREPA